VSEGEIAQAMRDVMLADHMVIEGAGGVAVAGWRKFTAGRPRLADHESVVVLCGGNVSAEVLAQVLGKTGSGRRETGGG